MRSPASLPVVPPRHPTDPENHPFDELLTVGCLRAGLLPANDVFNLLSEHCTGASKGYVFRRLAYNGRVDLLEALCTRGWSDDCTYGDVFFAATDGGDASRSSIAVLKWLVVNRATLDSGDDELSLEGGNWMIHETGYVLAILMALTNEDVDAAEYLMDHSHDLFVRGSHTDPNHELVFEVMNEGAFESLEFLCERWGAEFMIKSVEKWLRKRTVDGGVFQPRQRAELKRWLKKRSKIPVSVITDWNAACSKANV